MKVSLTILATLCVAHLAAASCLDVRAHCGNGGSPCCPGLVCGDNISGSTSKMCVPAHVTTTTAPTTTTTTTQPGATTTTTESVPTTTTTTLPQGATYPDAGLRFSVADLLPTAAQPTGFTGHVVDPRTGQPANQFVLATIDWQLKALVAQAVAVLDSAGQAFNEDQVLNSALKFGGDYWLLHQAIPESGHYQVLQPTYVREYTLPTIIAAGLSGGVTSPVATLPPGSILDGLLSYVPGHYRPLSADQCAALAAAEQAHMAGDMRFFDYEAALAAGDPGAPDILADAERLAANGREAQVAFERTARDINEATVFVWTWDGDYNLGNPPEVRIGLTRGLIKAHDDASMSFNCETGKSPDVGAIVHFRMLHNFLHIRRATVHWLDKPTYTVCPDTQISSCPRLNSRDWAAQF